MITPLACTVVDWQTFNMLHKQAGVSEPTRALDTYGLSTQTPASFLATFGGPNLINNLRSSYVSKRTDLIHMVFAIEADCDTLRALHDTRLVVTQTECITLISGTLTTYIDAIVCYSIRKHPLQSLLNAIYVYLDRGGFRECFNDYTREADGDNFIVRRR